MLLILFKGLGYSISLGSFRGGPTFPAIFLGAAGGILASHLPGFSITAAVAVGIGTGVTAILQQKTAAYPTGITTRQFTGFNSGTIGTILSSGTLVGQSRQLLALLQMQETRTRAKVLSAPSVIATDSIPASITVGDSVPTLSYQAVNPGVTSSGNSLFTQTISNTSRGIAVHAPVLYSIRWSPDGSALLFCGIRFPRNVPSLVLAQHQKVSGQ